MELNVEQIKRQDFVDNKIFNLLKELNPTGHKLGWDIEAIGEIRDTIQSLLVERRICTEQEFYPYIET